MMVKSGQMTFCTLLALIFLFLTVPALAQEDSETPLLGPLNSDPLTERGISPRVLDIALFPMSQGVAFEMMVSYQANGVRGDRRERFRMVYDPDTEYGRDLYIEFENEPLRSLKQYRRSLEVSMGSDYWVRQKARLYDPKSLRVIESKGGREVISFRYDKANVPTKQRWLLLLEGRLYIQDGVLQRIDFVAERTIERDGVRNENYRSSVVFGAVPEHGGYLIDQMEEVFSFHSKGGLQHIHTHSRVIEYTHSKLGSIVWNRMPTKLIVESTTDPQVGAADVALVKEEPDPVTRGDLEKEFETASTVKLDLHRTLPFWADDVRKLGFELPKTYGIGVIGMMQDGEFEIQDISVGGISAVDDIPLIERLGNKTDSNISTLQLRADFWVLPFLNLSVIGGKLKTDSDVTLNFTPLFQTLYKLKTGDELPATVQFPASTTGSTLGIGLTTGFKYESLVMSASLTYAETVTNETNSQINALVFVGLVGYDFGDIGMQVLSGIQYLDTDRTLTGLIDLGEGQDPLEFSLDLRIEQTLFMAGINKDIGRNWNLSAFLGLNGTRKQGTVMFGYRW
jgi:hypothetical protein